RAPQTGTHRRGRADAHPGGGGAERAGRTATGDALRAGSGWTAAPARRAHPGLSPERGRGGPPPAAALAMRRLLIAAFLALSATVVAAAVVTFGGTGVAVLGGALRDRWALALAPVSGNLSIVMRDAAAEQQLGAGTWDRAVVARVVGALALNGAT